MKFLTLVICSLLCNSHQLKAQKDNWHVKAGEEVNDAVPPDVKFRYPQFVAGNVYFKNGAQSAAPLNYNLLNEEMEFINSNGDTLSLDNEATINYITINNDSFFYSKVYLELVAGNPLVKLAKKQRLKIGDVSKIGAYNQSSSSSAITSVTSLYNRAGVTNLAQRADLLLVKETIYYVGDYYNHFLPASKKNVIKMFGRKEDSINNFLQENKTRFNNEDDLKKLINFLQTSQ